MINRLTRMLPQLPIKPVAQVGHRRRSSPQSQSQKNENPFACISTNLEPKRGKETPAGGSPETIVARDDLSQQIRLVVNHSKSKYQLLVDTRADVTDSAPLSKDATTIDVEQPILGSNFLKYHGLLFYLRKFQLVDGKTNIEIKSKF